MKSIKYIVVAIFAIMFVVPPMFSQSLQTEKEWEEYFAEKIIDLDPIEGIWSFTLTVKLFNYDRQINQASRADLAKIVIYKRYNGFIGQKLSGNGLKDILITFKKTAIPSVYIFDGMYSYSSVKANASMKDFGLLEFSFEVPEAGVKEDTKQLNPGRYRETWDCQFIKLYPQEQQYSKSQLSSGTGFAITADGMIATNNHVIEGATKISVRGINGRFDITYNAKVVIIDKNNDLALIKIEDYNFTSIGKIPYIIKSTVSNAGENIFVLGYPLRASMGDEIKLTNGIISSKTGYQGDITTYQISAPIQPGNSGGPLFDSQGNLTGIINAKLVGAENASYAVKVSYLINLIEILDNPPTIQTVSSLNGKTLVQQVEIAKKFVYIIEVQ